MIRVVIIYEASGPNQVLEEEIQRLARLTGGEFFGSGFTSGERDLEYRFPVLTDAVSQHFVQKVRSVYPGLRVEITDVVPLNLAVCRKAIELLQQHEKSAIDLLNELCQNAPQLSHQEALEILASLTKNFKTGIVPAWNGAIAALVAAMLGGDTQE
jgi:hypothetical protein